MAYNTAQKTALMQTLKNAGGSALSAAQIIELMKKNNFQASKSTVYRLLDEYTKRGIVNRYRVSNCFVYSLNDRPLNCTHHLHLQCERCHRLIHLDEEKSQNIQASVKSAGFEIDKENTTIWGLCKECIDG